LQTKRDGDGQKHARLVLRVAQLLARLAVVRDAGSLTMQTDGGRADMPLQTGDGLLMSQAVVNGLGLAVRAYHQVLCFLILLGEVVGNGKQNTITKKTIQQNTKKQSNQRLIPHTHHYRHGARASSPSHC
jgi:hypothetical protein